MRMFVIKIFWYFMPHLVNISFCTCTVSHSKTYLPQISINDNSWEILLIHNQVLHFSI